MQHPGLFPERLTSNPQFPELEQQQIKCPRCESTNTKFCYYNNYNLSQPRHFCKSCRRYWTKGGALRNVPVGGGSRKNSKKSSASKPKNSADTAAVATTSFPCSSSSSPFPKREPDLPSVNYGPVVDDDHRLLDITGTFSSLLASNGHFGSLCEPMSSRIARPQGDTNVPENGWGLPEYSDGEVVAASGDNGEALLGDPGCWVGGTWPDLSMYTPGSNFQ